MISLLFLEEKAPKTPGTGKDVIKRVKRQARLSVLERVITSYLKSVITAFCSRVASDIPRPAERWSALLWGAKAPVVANIARPQWCHLNLSVDFWVMRTFLS